MTDVDVFELELQDLHEDQANPNVAGDSDDDIIEIDDVSIAIYRNALYIPCGSKLCFVRVLRGNIRFGCVNVYLLAPGMYSSTSFFLSALHWRGAVDCLPTADKCFGWIACGNAVHGHSI